MRIAFTHAYCWPEVRRGAERFIPSLGAALVRRGHEVVHLTAADSPGREVVDGVETVRLRRLRERGYAHDADFGRRVLPQLAMRRFDAVHSMGRRDAMASVRAARVHPRRRTVYTDLGIPTRDAWRGFPKEARAVEKVVAGIDVYSCMSRWAVDHLRSEYGRRDGAVVPGGVDFGRFVPAPERESYPVILFSGALDVPHKEIPLLLEALALVAREEPDAELWLSGEGDPEPLLAAAPQAARERTRAMGVGEAHRQHERYGRAWVTCLPSRHDSFGMALVESLACGTPLVTTTAGRAPRARLRARDGGALRSRRRAGACGRLLAGLRAGPPADDRGGLPGVRPAIRLGPWAGAAGRAAVRGGGRRRRADRRAAVRGRSASRLSLLVTGPAGYIGAGLVHELLDDGWDVVGLGRERVDYLPIDQVVADLNVDRELTREACEGADCVVHLAGENEVFAARDPAAALGETVTATERLVEAVAASRAKRLVYMSTVHVYGEQIREGATITEDLRPEPRGAYPVSRLASEHLVAALAAHGTEVVVLRLTNSVGAPIHPSVDRWTLVANDLCRQGALTGRLVLRSSGVQWRDFVALRDVHAAVVAACRSDTLPPGRYNLGSGEPMTVRSLAELVQDAFERSTGTRPELDAPDPGPDPPAPYRVSVERAASHGIRNDTPVASAVEETVRFCVDNREALPA